MTFYGVIGYVYYSFFVINEVRSWRLFLLFYLWNEGRSTCVLVIIEFIVVLILLLGVRCCFSWLGWVSFFGIWVSFFRSRVLFFVVRLGVVLFGCLLVFFLRVVFVRVCLFRLIFAFFFVGLVRI